MTEPFDPEEWTRRFQEKVNDAKRRAEHARDTIAEASITKTSRDGSLTITVNSSGALLHAQFGIRASGYTPGQLSALLMNTYAEATIEAAQHIHEVMTDLVGDDSEAMDVLRVHVPAPTDESDYR